MNVSITDKAKDMHSKVLSPKGEDERAHHRTVVKPASEDTTKHLIAPRSVQRTPQKAASLTAPSMQREVLA